MGDLMEYETITLFDEFTKKVTNNADYSSILQKLKKVRLSLDSKSEDRLIELLKQNKYDPYDDPYAIIRKHIILVLGTLEKAKKGTIKALIPYLKDGDVCVRTVTAQTLEKIGVSSLGQTNNLETTEEILKALHARLEREKETCVCRSICCALEGIEIAKKKTIEMSSIPTPIEIKRPLITKKHVRPIPTLGSNKTRNLISAK